MPPQALIGRDAEFAAVAGFCARADGTGFLLLEGDPGMGKSSLLSALGDGQQDGRDVRVLRPAEAERRLPFATLQDLLGEVDDPVLAALPDAQRCAVEAALCRGSGSGRAGALAVALAVRGVLRTWSRARTVVLVVDDAQWVDPSSAQVLAHALRRLSVEPVRVVTARRRGVPGGLDLGPGLPPDRTQRLVLRGLSVGALDRLLEERRGLRLAGPALARLAEATAGNPFYALELAPGLVGQAETGPGRPVPVPPSLATLVGRRLEGLTGAAADLVLLAAAAARPRVTQLAPAPEVLAETLAAGVLRLAPDGEGLAFDHPLLAAAAYARAPAPARREGHRRLARLVPDPDEAVLHEALGAEGSDRQLVARLTAAAARSARRGATAAAGELLEQAARLVPEGDADTRARLLVLAGRRHVEAGDHAHSRRLLEPVVAGLPPGHLRAEALAQLSLVLPTVPEQVAACRQGLAEALGDEQLEARLALLLYSLGTLDGTYGRYRDRVVASMRAADARGDEGTWVELAAFVAGIRMGSGGGMDRELLDAVGRRYDPHRPPSLLIQSVGATVGVQHLWADDLPTARGWLERELRVLDGAGRVDELHSVLVRLVQLEVRAGRYDEAERHVERLREIALPVAYAEDWVHSAAAAISTARGRVQQAREQAHAALRCAEACGDPSMALEVETVLVQLDLSLDDAPAAHARAVRILPGLDALGFGDPAVVPLLPEALEAAVTVGEYAEASRLLGRLEERGRTLDRACARAAAARGRGSLLAATGSPEQALEAFAEALRQHDRFLFPLERARTLLAHGSALRRLRRKADATRVLEQARDAFGDLGAERWRERTQAELARVGLRPAAAVGEGGLTEAERQVVALVADGRTNREVAARLCMSPRTVEAHLSRVYAKLQVRSRTELARWARSESAGAGQPVRP